MIVSRPPVRRKQKRGGLRFIFVVATTTAMVATGGFGAFPDNPLTQTFQEVFSENFSADFLQPFNSYMENISAPTIQPRPASISDQGSLSDPLGFLTDLFPDSASVPPAPLPDEAEIVNTAMASIQETQTQHGILTASPTLPAGTPTLIQTETPGMTPSPSATVSLTPTATILWVYIPPTSTKKPPPANTPTFTLTPKPFLGFSVSTVNLNGAGTSVAVGPQASVNVTYNFSVFDDPCPSCITQLVTGLGTTGSHGGTCAFDGDAALFPGTAGSENVNLTAPQLPGLYPVVVEYHWQYTCDDALAAYGSNGAVPSQTIGQIEVSCISAGDIVSIPGENWYFGNGFCSCEDVCAAKGGVNLAVFNTVGDDLDGGSNAKCNQVLSLFLGPGSTVDWAPVGAFVGCHLDTNGSWRARYINETATTSASSGNVKRVCACNN